MTRIVITGGPRTGKTTLAGQLPQLFMVGALPLIDVRTAPILHTDDLIAELAHLGKDAWSEGSRRVAEWLDAPGPWIIEGVAVSRALRKWHEAHPGAAPPVDRVIYLTEPYEPLTPGQASMAKGVEKVHRELVDWLNEHGVATEVR